MPKTNRDGSAKKSELPSTLERSGEKAQRTYAHTYDSAMESYDGDEERAQRTAFASLKHTHEKVGDHWESKDEPGPSDSGATTAGGVDANATKEHVLDLAKRLDVRGRSTMTKAELVEALQKANDKATREARGN
ncbi:ChaB family protein [Propioniciclava soli]|uniref:ChaB family protein n=1 Tax=Propioniciclava soli TaxID=2775081 RepID=A0ABZ3C613_9ACTN